MLKQSEPKPETLDLLRRRLASHIPPELMLSPSTEELISIADLEDALRLGEKQGITADRFFSEQYDECIRALRIEQTRAEEKAKKRSAQLSAAVTKLLAQANAFLSLPLFQRMQASWFSFLSETDLSELARAVLEIDRVLEGIAPAFQAEEPPLPFAQPMRKAIRSLMMLTYLENAAETELYRTWRRETDNALSGITAAHATLDTCRQMEYEVVHRLTPELRHALLSAIDFSAGEAPTVRGIPEAKKLFKDMQSYRVALTRLTEIYSTRKGDIK